MAKKLDPIPPGEILAEEFMKPGRISCRTAEREGGAAQAHPRRGPRHRGDPA
jgi:plasmid maintenance system antidote protein VapI